MEERHRKDWLSFCQGRRKQLQKVLDSSHAAEAELLMIGKYDEAEAQRRRTLEAMVALERVELQIEHVSRAAPV